MPGLFARKSETLVDDETSSVAFERATDDADLVAFAAGTKPAPDARSERLAALLDLPRSLPYWIGLLRDARPAVRALAAARLAKIAGLSAATGELSAAELDAAGADLDADSWERREQATARLEAAGESARPRLEALAASGSAEQRERARSLLATLRDRALVGPELEHARLARWLERERDRLIWSDEKQQWLVKDFR